VIIRKPYALLIKNFRFIHIILTLLMGFVFYSISPLSNLFNSAINNQTVHYGRDLVSEFVSPNIYLSIILIIMISLLVLWLMIAKKKPYLVYLYLAFTYAIIFGLLWFTQLNLEIMSNNLLDLIILSNFRDFLTIASFVQIISIVIAFVRSTGFDIKKFNFTEDLEELDINDEDREEVELQLEFDWDKYIASIKRKIRHSKYFYLENRFMVNLVLVVFTISISLYGYILTNFLNRSFRQNDIVVMSSINASVKKSYVTAYDYKNLKISNDFKLVVVEVALQSKKEDVLELNTVYLTINSSRYTPINDYSEHVKDLGSLYNYERLSEEYKNYLLVYKVDKNVDLKDSKLVLSDYIFDGSKNFTKKMRVKLNIVDLDQEKVVTDYVFGEQISFEDIKFSTFEDIKINMISIDPYLELDYSFCINKTDCKQSVEILRPRLNSYEKDILTIEGEFNFNFPEFMTLYGIIEYENSNTNLLKEVKPTRSKKPNVYYFEIPRNSEGIKKIIFNIRNYQFEYSL
jgi:hypothetical protein